MNNGRNRIKKSQIIFAAPPPDCFGQFRRSQRTSGNDDLLPIFGNIGNFFTMHRDQGVAVDLGLDSGGKSITINCQSATSRHFFSICSLQYQGSQNPHFLMQNTNSICRCIIRSKRIGTNQLGKAFAMVRIGFTRWAHFMDHNRHIHAGNLKGSLTTSKTTTNHMNRSKIIHHKSLF